MALFNLLMAARKLCTFTVMSMIPCLSRKGWSSLAMLTLGRGMGVEVLAVLGGMLPLEMTTLQLEGVVLPLSRLVGGGGPESLLFTRGLVGVALEEWMGDSVEREALRGCSRKEREKTNIVMVLIEEENVLGYTVGKRHWYQRIWGGTFCDEETLLKPPIAPVILFGSTTPWCSSN